MTIRESRRMITVLLVLLILVDVVCIGVLLSPLAKSRQAKEAELHDLQQQFQQRRMEVGGSVGMDKKLASATTDIHSFYQQRLSGQYSVIDAALVKSATANGVELYSVSYRPAKKGLDDLQQIEIDMTISGPYVNDVKFINALERDKVFFLIDNVSLAGSTNGVQLQVRAETYFRTGAA